MEVALKDISNSPKAFFKILPVDWQESIAPQWDYFKGLSTLYVIEEDNQIIAGGIVFSTCPPDMMYYEEESQQWFDQGYLYIGYLWVAEDKRNQQMGTKWLTLLKQRFPKQKFWLTIEEENLKWFYEKNEFTLIGNIQNGNYIERIYSYVPIT